MRYSIGIDPGKKTGFAVYSIDDSKLVEVCTLDFWEVIHRIELNYAPEFVHEVTVEVPKSTHVWHSKGANMNTAAKTGLNVGKVLREAELMAEGLYRMGYPVRRVEPRGKVDQYKFADFTGWTKRCSQHARDAALLCYRRGPSAT